MSEQKIIEFLKKNGPSSPAQVGKILGVQLLFASAMLGEAASKGHVKISKMKNGSSPLYYLESTKDQLANFSERLNSKDRQSFELLKEQKVMRDKDQTPIVRVSLRAIKDFAIPLNIVRNGETEIFWKWYMLSDNDATSTIKNIFSKADGLDIDKVEVPIEKKEKQEIKSNIVKQESAKEEVVINKEITTKEEIEDTNSDEDYIPKENINKNTNEEENKDIINNIPVKEKAIKPKEEIIEKESQTKLENNNNTLKDEKTTKGKDSKNAKENTPGAVVDVINTVVKEEIDEKEIKLSSNPLNEEFSVECTSDFGVKIYNYFKERNFQILHYNLDNKKTKFSFIINVPNAVSSTKYYAKAIDKKTINDGDLALVIVEGNYNSLPSILFTTANISKKIEEKLSNLFKQLTIIKV